MLNAIDMLPIQLKHNHETHGIETKIGVKYVKDNTINEDECICVHVFFLTHMRCRKARRRGRKTVKYPESGEVLFAFSGLNSGGAAKRFTPHFDDCEG